MRDHRTVLQLITDIAGTSGSLVSGSRDYPNQTYYDWNVENKLEKGELPVFLDRTNRHEKRLERHEERGNDTEFTAKPYDTYRLKCFLAELGRVLFQSEQEVRERLEELRNAENPYAKYNDGSAGQWRICNAANIRAVEWLLEELEDGGRNQ